MLLTLRGGPESFAPRAHQIPVYLLVFSTFLCRAFTAHRAVMIGDPLAILAIDAPDSHRGAHHVLGHVTRHALRLRGDSTLLHVGHEAVGIRPKTRIHPRVDRLRLERLAHHASQVPLPLATQEIVGHVLQMLPARALGLIAPAGGEQMQVRVIRPMASMGVEHGDGAPSECLAPDGAKEIIQALRPTAHERAQHDRRVLVQGRAEHRRDRQDDMPRDDPRMEGLAHLAHPVVDMDLGAASAPRRCAAHRHPMGALTTPQAAVCDRAHLCRVATRQHLGHQALVVGRLVARMGVGKRVPVLGTDLLEDTPVPRGVGHHRVTPRGGDERLVMQRLYHASAASSSPPPPVPRQPSPASVIPEL